MAMLPILAAVAGAGPPPNNASLCAVESCMVMPTGCGQRPECAGCGELCFGSGGRGDDAAGWDLFLNATGLSDQDNAASVFRGSGSGCSSCEQDRGQHRRRRHLLVITSTIPSVAADHRAGDPSCSNGAA